VDQKDELVVSLQSPLPPGNAWISVARCVVDTARLVAQRRIHQPRTHLDERLHFGDGTSARGLPGDRRRPPAANRADGPCGGVPVSGVRGRGHALFRLERELNTPLFVGFNGFVSKLW
jgi:hypothetical protein